MFTDTQGAIRKAYADTAIGQAHYRYAAPAESERTAPPVVMFGTSPNSGAVFEEMVIALAKDRCAIAFDTPGYGQSARPAAPFDSALQFAEVFLDALDAMGVRRMDLFGDHSGATLALAIAAVAPDRVGRIMLTAVPYIADKAVRTERRDHSPIQIDRAEHVPAEQRRWDHWVEQRPPALSFGRAMDLYADAMSPGAYTHWLHRAVFADDVETWLTGIKTPVLFLQTQDPLSPWSRDLAPLLIETSFEDRLDLDHFAFQTQADEIAGIFRRFSPGG